MRILFMLFIWVGGSLFTTEAHAQQPAWYANVEALVKAHLPAASVSHEITILTAPAALESLQQCQSVNAEFTRPPERLAGRVMVKVTCDNHQLFIQLQVSVVGDYLVAAQVVPRGGILTAAAIKAQRGQLQGLPRHTLLATKENINQIIGQQTRRKLNINAVIQKNLLSKPKVISFGDDITLTAQGQGFKITRKGTSLDTGAVGDIIRVRIEQQQIIRAQVTSKGHAKPLQ